MTLPSPLPRRAILLLAMFVGLAPAARAGTFVVHPAERVEMKAVYGRVEPHDLVDARARIGGTIVSLAVEAGSAVKAGNVIATVVDDKIALQRDALDAQIKGVQSQLLNATTQLDRGKALFASGTIPKSSLDSLQTAADVLANQVSAAEAQRSVLAQQESEGQVLAPADGRVLSVPVTRGSVILPGETVARVAGGGFFLRLSLPERHAAQIHQGDPVKVGGRGLVPAGADMAGAREGRLVKIYPEIQGGQVLADAEVDGLGDFFAGERTLVWIPVDRRTVIAVPPQAITTRFGIDYVTVNSGAATADVAVITGEAFATADGPRIEILSGLVDGDTVVTP
jgi:RND family efflux transporter MFP subunit